MHESVSKWAPLHWMRLWQEHVGLGLGRTSQIPGASLLPSGSWQCPKIDACQHRQTPAQPVSLTYIHTYKHTHTLIAHPPPPPPFQFPDSCILRSWATTAGVSGYPFSPSDPRHFKGPRLEGGRRGREKREGGWSYFCGVIKFPRLTSFITAQVPFACQLPQNHDSVFPQPDPYCTCMTTSTTLPVHGVMAPHPDDCHVAQRVEHASMMILGGSRAHSPDGQGISFMKKPSSV